ncbi:MAG: type II toxin-antitoxin system VapC family toxin [Candidatus Zixiibacteriota bacterium]
MHYITDTHPLVWHIIESPNLSKNSAAIFNNADRGTDHVVIPCIVLFEILYLIEKKKIPEFLLDNLIEKVLESKNYLLEPLCIPIILQCKNISSKKVSDPGDRIIAATTLHLNLPLITRDEKLKQIGLTTIC